MVRNDHLFALRIHMATSKEYYEYITENLNKVGEITTRKMMGEYCVYYKSKLIGDICDNTFLIKQTKISLKFFGENEKAYPYEGSKTLMIVVDDAENTELLRQVFDGMYDELPDSKKR